VFSMRVLFYLLLILVVACITTLASSQQELNGIQVHVALTGKPNQYSIMCITDSFAWVRQQQPLESLVFEYKLNNDSSYIPSDAPWRSYTYKSNAYYGANVHELLFTVPNDLKNNDRSPVVVHYRIGISSDSATIRYTKTFSFVAHAQTRATNNRKRVIDYANKKRMRGAVANNNKFVVAGDEEQEEDNSFTFLTFGDMDTTYPAQETMAHIRELISQGSKQPKQSDFIHLIIHQGDIPYAWSEEKWDQWGKLIEPIASSLPYMTVPGNHESNYDFTSYRNRFSNMTSMNSRSPQGNIYYSFDYRTVHFIGLSSEHDFSVGSQQYQWLLNDLQSVDRRKTPFVITFSHRPQYSSNMNHGSALDFRQAIEPVLVKYKVDLSLFGHVHAYERSCPIVGAGKCGDNGVTNLCVGTAGFELNRDWEEKPEWSMYRETSHGVAKIKVNGSKSLQIYYLPNGEDRIGDEHEIFVRPEFQ